MEVWHGWVRATLEIFREGIIILVFFRRIDWGFTTQGLVEQVAMHVKGGFE